jgi:hypothetical protein
VRLIVAFLGCSFLVSAQSVLIQHATVVDATGAAPKVDFSVLIRDGRIASVARKVEPPVGATVINARGKFLIPGLWDMHVHITDPRVQFPLLVANGVIGVREMYSAVSIYTQREWSRLPSAPRVLMSGFIDGPQPRPTGIWPDAYAIVDVESANAAVQLLHLQKPDFIKIYNGVPRAAFFALASATRAAGLPFAGHVPEEISPLEASDAGMRSQEHLNNLLLAASTQEIALRQQRINVMNDVALSGAARLRLLGWPLTEGLFDTYDPRKAARLFKAFANNGTFQTPTLAVLAGYAHAVDDASMNDPRRRFLPKSWTDLWTPQGSPYLNDLSPDEYHALNRRMRALLARYEKLVGDMFRAGVPILAGTDTNPVNPVLPGWGLHEELALLVESGLTPMQALQTATINPARYFVREKETGTIEPGRSADLVLLDADPLANIRNTQRINAVIMRGQLYSRDDLDAMLETLNH